MKTFERKYSFDVKPELTAELKSANLGIKIFGWNEPRAELQVKIEALSNGEVDLNFDELIEIDHDEDNNQLKISIDDPDELRNYKSNIKLFLPHVSDLKAEIENAGLQVENIEGKLVMKSENGSLKFDHVNGSIEAATENGAVKLRNCVAEIKLETENGALKLNDCEGNIKVNSENGVFKAARCSGSLELEGENGMVRITESALGKAFVTTENGGIYYEFTELEKGQFDFQNQNGKLQLVIPDKLPFHITASNKWGRFHIGLEGNYDQSSKDEKKTIQMVKGSGNVKIDLKNENGSINLMKKGASNHSINIDFSSVSKLLDKATEHLPKEIDQEKVRLKLEKAKEKLKNIKLPDMEKINVKVEKALDDVSQELGNMKVDFSIDEIKEKAEEKITDIVENVKGKLSKDELSTQEKQRVNERSRMKILELLQEGKINADEAERLIKAMEGRNGE